MKLKKYTKRKSKKKVLIGSIVGVVLLIGGITLYRTFALYEEKKEFNVLKGRVGDFRNSSKDIEISAIVNGQKSEEIPSKEEGYIVEKVVCTNSATAEWDNEEWTLTIKKLTTSETTCSLNFYPKQFNEFIIAKSKGNEEIEEFHHEETEQTPALTDYRYTGANPNNYVCFGSEETTCPEENLYRIIGVIPTQSEGSGEYENRVKLIKNDFYIEEESGYLKTSSSTRSGFGYMWGVDWTNNNWEESPLNLEVLNKVYWKQLGRYQEYISKNIWYLGALDYEKNNIYTPNEYYLAERSMTRSLSQGNISTFTNIGLMYPSDYGYALGRSYENKSTNQNNELYQSRSWLYQLEKRYYEWTISSDYTYSVANVFAIYDRGLIAIQGVYDSRFYHGIRPTFYLKESTKYKSGVGTQENPFRIII